MAKIEVQVEKKKCAPIGNTLMNYAYCLKYKDGNWIGNNEWPWIEINACLSLAAAVTSAAI
jgi:hypothetical protein